MNDDEESKDVFKDPKIRKIHQSAIEKLKEFTDPELLANRQKRNENGFNKPGDVSRN